ncbi:hypothetical protein BH10PSE10_BH10PSE10_14400 [soil metagenome]
MHMRKVIAFDDDTWQALVQLGRDRMATLQELADESFADLLKKHGVPKDLKDALRRSAAKGGKAAKGKSGGAAARKSRR